VHDASFELEIFVEMRFIESQMNRSIQQSKEMSEAEGQPVSAALQTLTNTAI
jgi:hypothetical protein